MHRVRNYAQRIMLAAVLLSLLPSVAFAQAVVVGEPWWVPLAVASVGLALGAWREYRPKTPGSTNDDVVAVVSEVLTPAMVRRLAKMLNPSDHTREGTTIPGAPL